jgi:hypothetical protein
MIEKKLYEFNHSVFWLEDNIIHIVYKKYSIITLDIAKEIVKARIQVQQHKSYLGIAYIDNSTVMSAQARRYMANEGYAGVSKVAVVISSPLKAAMVNVFIFLDRPLKPTKLFTNKEEAIKWLKG